MAAMNAHAQLSREFHLFTESFAGSTATQPPLVPSLAQAAGTDPIIVPPGVSRLTWLETGARLHPATQLTTGPRLEPLNTCRPERRLLLACAPATVAHVNGLPARRLTLLTEADRFHFATGPLFRVAVFHRPQVGPVPSPLVGTACAVCTLALAAGDRCFVCPCGTPLHTAEDESAEGALSCVKMVTHCPHCQQPVRLVPGYGELSEPNHE